MAAAPVKPYEGKEPYIFISYSHKDSDRVFPILKHLDEKGFRIWYDEGIDPGTEWPESIAQHLMASKVCIAFVSENSLASHNCRREINFALSRSQIGFLSVMLEDAKMTPGVELQLSTYQSLLMYKYSDQREFYDKLVNVDLLEPCRRPQEAAPVPVAAPQHTGTAAPASVKEQEAAPAVKEKPVKTAKSSKTEDGGKNKMPLYIGIAAGAVALIVLLIVMLSGKGSENDPTRSAENTTAATQEAKTEAQTAEKTTEAQTDATEAASDAETAAPTEAETLPAGELSDDFADSTFKLDDVVYQLPFAFTELTKNGWTISSSGTSDQTTVDQGGELSFKMVKNGASIEVTAVNAGTEAADVADCQIGGITVQQSSIQDASRFCVSKGLTPFSTLEEAKEAFGPASALATRSSYVRMTYGLLASNCTVFDYYPDSEKYNTLRVTHYPAAQQAERLSELSDDIRDYTFLLDDVLYQLPFDFTQLTDNGWTISSRGVSDQTKVGGYQDYYFDMTKNGASITVYAVNASGSARAVGDCQIGGISVQQSSIQDVGRFCMAKNITTGSTQEEIKAALGEGDNVSESSSSVSIYYGKNNNYSKIYLYKENANYNKIDIRNYPTEPEPTETVMEMPEYLAAYTAPAALGDNLFSGIVELEGDLYQLPAPISCFLENGWELSYKPGVIASLSHDTATLTKDGKNMDVTVKNLAEVQTLTENCFVSQINIQTDAGIAFALPQDVKLGTRKSVVDGLALEFYTSEYSDYYYYNKTDKETGVMVGLRMDKEQEQVESLRLEGGDWKY